MKKMKRNRFLQDFIRKCEERFGEKLVSVILFGSRAKNIQSKTSDWDFLVVIKNLPEKRTDRWKEFKQIKKYIYRKYEEFIQVIPVTPEELLEGPTSPLIYGLLTGYKVLYGDDFWENYLKNLKIKLKNRNPIYVEGGKEWKVKELI